MNTKLIAEYLYQKRLITEVYPNGLVGSVSDTFNLWDVLSIIAPALKAEIMARDGKVVFRPDSGDPVKILTGYKWIEDDSENLDLVYGEMMDDVEYEVVKHRGSYYFIEPIYDAWSFDIEAFKIGESLSESEVKGAVEILWEQFGGTINEKGFKELDSHVGLIYGDSITMERCEAICERLKDKGFSSGNVVFGVGSYTYQMITRDTFGMAMKATYCEINGEGREIFKDPITDDGVKKSAKGLLMVVDEPGPEKIAYKLVDQVSWQDVNADCNELKVVFEDGGLAGFPQTLSEMRKRVEDSL